MLNYCLFILIGSNTKSLVIGYTFYTCGSFGGLVWGKGAFYGEIYGKGALKGLLYGRGAFAGLL